MVEEIIGLKVKNNEWSEMKQKIGLHRQLQLFLKSLTSLIKYIFPGLWNLNRSNLDCKRLFSSPLGAVF